MSGFPSWQERAEALEKYSRHLEAELSRRNHSIQMILENVSFGFFLIDREQKLQDGFSHICNELFGRRLNVGDELATLLGLSTEVERLTLALSINQVFEDVLPEDLCLTQLPKRFVVRDVVLNLDGRVVRGPDREVVGLLFNVTDATALEATRKLSRNRDVLIGILRQRAAFEDFVKDTRGNLANVESSRCQTTLRRVVHTIKGNAGAWGLDDVVTAAHALEAEAVLTPCLVKQLEQTLVAFLQVNEAVLGMKHLLEDRRESRSSSISFRPSRRVPPGRRPASDLLGPVERYAYDVAARLGKTIQVRLGGMDVSVDVDRMRPVLRALPHLIHNAIDHGIEPPSERGGKPQLGCLSIELRDHTDYWELEVTDDGRGVQLDKLAARSSRFGSAAQNAPAGLDLMFLDGVTTADHATEISGRGLGMAALREAVRQSGGSIDVTSSTEGTCVRIHVPVCAPQVGAIEGMYE